MTKRATKSLHQDFTKGMYVRLQVLQRQSHPPGTKATTHKDTTTIDVDDCTLFCPQQWIMINDGSKSRKIQRSNCCTDSSCNWIRG